MPIWFLIVIALCMPFAILAMVRSFSSEGMYIAGERVSRPTILLAATIIMIAFGLLAATQLGFIPNHAP